MCKILKSIRIEKRVIDFVLKQPGENFSVKLNKFVWRSSFRDLTKEEKRLLAIIKELKSHATKLQLELDKSSKSVKHLLCSPLFQRFL